MIYLIFFLVCIVCCFITYKITCSKIIKLDKTNSQLFNEHQKYIGISLDEIAGLKTAILQIKKDIYR